MKKQISQLMFTLALPLYVCLFTSVDANAAPRKSTRTNLATERYSSEATPKDAAIERVYLAIEQSPNYEGVNVRAMKIQFVESGKATVPNTMGEASLERNYFHYKAIGTHNGWIETCEVTTFTHDFCADGCEDPPLVKCALSDPQEVPWQAQPRMDSMKLNGRYHRRRY